MARKERLWKPVVLTHIVLNIPTDDEIQWLIVYFIHHLHFQDSSTRIFCRISLLFTLVCPSFLSFFSCFGVCHGNSMLSRSNRLLLWDIHQSEARIEYRSVKKWLNTLMLHFLCSCYQLRGKGCVCLLCSCQTVPARQTHLCQQAQQYTLMDLHHLITTATGWSTPAVWI